MEAQPDAAEARFWVLSVGVILLYCWASHQWAFVAASLRVGPGCRGSRRHREGKTKAIQPGSMTGTYATVTGRVGVLDSACGVEGRLGKRDGREEKGAQ